MYVRDYCTHTYYEYEHVPILAWQGYANSQKYENITNFTFATFFF